MTQDFTNRATGLVVTLGLASEADILFVKPLTGGVASDIGVVQTTGGAFCVKFALERLRVAQDWRVPVSRNRAEYDWLAFAGSIVPGAVPAGYPGYAPVMPPGYPGVMPPGYSPRGT